MKQLRVHLLTLQIIDSFNLIHVMIFSLTLPPLPLSSLQQTSSQIKDLEIIRNPP